MVEKHKTQTLKLPAEIRTSMLASEERIEKAKHALGVMKKLGMDVSGLEGKLAWAEEVRSTMLKEFG